MQGSAFRDEQVDRVIFGCEPQRVLPQARAFEKACVQISGKRYVECGLNRMTGQKGLLVGFLNGRRVSRV